MIYVSDHGEEFAEHGRWEHGLSLYEEVLRVPLVMRLPGVPARRVAEPAQHVDVLPTLLGYLGIEAPPTDGRDLLAPRRRGDTPPDVYTHLDVDGHRAASVMRGRYKLVLPQSPSQGVEPMLFDLEADPGELEDLAADRPDIVERMLGLLAERNLADEVESPKRSRRTSSTRTCAGVSGHWATSTEETAPARVPAGSRPAARLPR